MALLFLDECSYEPLDLAALTGVLVPLTAYIGVRDAVCRITWDVLTPPQDTVPQPIELHGRDLLSEIGDRDEKELDRLRIQVYADVVRIVNDNNLRVFRFAYLNRSEIAAAMNGDPQLYGLNFANIQIALQTTLAETIVFPVMDGIPGCDPAKSKAPRINPQLIRAFAQQVRWIHHARQCSAVADSISIKNVANLAEPVFADSAHSTLLQLTDLVSYLLLQLDREELQPCDSPSDYRKEVLICARNFRPALLHRWKGCLTKT
jgi:hypothetical protein